MKRTITLILTLVFNISLCMAQNAQEQTQIDNRYQDAIASAQKYFSQRQYSEAKQYYLTARDLKPENAALINDIIAIVDKLLAVEANSGRQVSLNTGSDHAPAANYQGTMVPGSTLTEKLDWLVRSAESHNTYIVEVTADESIAPRTLAYKGGINITIILRGDNQNRTIRLSSHGTMFTVNTDVTFILDGNITLQGHKGNSGSMVYVEGGNLKMNRGTTITGNASRNSDGAGVYVYSGTFEMNGGTIFGNTANGGGGGVCLSKSFGEKAVFNMNDGTISNNIANSGGGVCMQGHSRGTFNMTGGIISGNTANEGGGIYAAGGGFNMTGGTVSGNSAREYGGGIYSTGNFTKTGGTISGYASSQSNGNVVKDDSGVLARRGHAAYYESSRSYVSANGLVAPTLRKETTAGPGTNLSSDNDNNWDQ